MATSKTERKPGTAERSKAARPVQSRQVGKRPPEPPRAQGGAPMTTRRPVHIEDEPLLIRSDRPRSDAFSDDDGFGGSER